MDHTLPPQDINVLTPTELPLTLACDACQTLLPVGTRCKRLTLGLNDDVAGAPERAPTVEEMTELVFCEACARTVSDGVDALLEGLWELRREPETAGASA